VLARAVLVVRGDVVRVKVVRTSTHHTVAEIKDFNA
jgi:hypothetical protein